MSEPSEGLEQADQFAARPAAWDRQPDEPSAAYVRFLVYLHLGPCRSVVLAARSASQMGKATGATKNRKKSEGSVSTQQWYNDSSRWNWRQRAESWDVYRLNDAADRVHSAIAELMIDLAHAACLSLRTGQMPKTYKESLNAFKQLCVHVPQDSAAVSEGEADPAHG